MQLGVKQANGGVNSASHERVMRANAFLHIDQMHRGAKLWKEAGYISTSENRDG